MKVIVCYLKPMWNPYDKFLQMEEYINNNDCGIEYNVNGGLSIINGKKYYSSVLCDSEEDYIAFNLKFGDVILGIR